MHERWSKCRSLNDITASLDAVSVGFRYVIAGADDVVSVGAIQIIILSVNSVLCGRSEGVC